MCGKKEAENVGSKNDTKIPMQDEDRISTGCLAVPGRQVRPISSSVGKSSRWVMGGAVSLLLHVLPRIFPRQADWS